jgi:bifunctional non-homologous end joining protein LigD
MPATRKRRPAKPADDQARFTNLTKVYWPEDGYTKGDLIEYYRAMSAIMLPYLRDRPQSLHRHPNGIRKASFFQKDVSRQPPPEWVRTVSLPVDTPDGKMTSIVCDNEATLLYMANLGCIEINPWNSRLAAIDHPDYLVIDLDPEAIAFQHVIEAAKHVHHLLDSAGVECHCKTSGKTGLHVYVPLGANYDYDLARQFAEVIANIVQRQLPKTTSVVRSPAQRQRRVYLDFLQNRRGQTVAAPYSVRPAPGATVSTPLKWSDVRPSLDPTKFTIRTVPQRVDRIGDLWKPVLGRGVDLERIVRKLTP